MLQYLGLCGIIGRSFKRRNMKNLNSVWILLGREGQKKNPRWLCKWNRKTVIFFILPLSYTPTPSRKNYKSGRILFSNIKNLLRCFPDWIQEIHIIRIIVFLILRPNAFHSNRLNYYNNKMHVYILNKNFNKIYW